MNYFFLKAGKNFETRCDEIISFYFIGFTRAELKPMEEVIGAGILTNVNIIASPSFNDDLKTFRTELVPHFISKCELLCFTQEIYSEDSLLHYLGVYIYLFSTNNFFFRRLLV